MSEAFGDNVHRLSRLEQQRRARVSEAVKLDSSNPGSLDQVRILPLSQVVRLQRLPDAVNVRSDVAPLLRKHQSELLVRRSISEFDFGLMLLVLSQQLDRFRR